jgi:hypothetical protein
MIEKKWWKNGLTKRKQWGGKVKGSSKRHCGRPKNPQVPLNMLGEEPLDLEESLRQGEPYDRWPLSVPLSEDALV